jgi:hypothetical protein
MTDLKKYKYYERNEKKFKRAREESVGSPKDMLKILLSNELADRMAWIEERKANAKPPAPPPEKSISYSEFKMAAKHLYVDVDAEKNGAHKMYQYT